MKSLKLPLGYLCKALERVYIQFIVPFPHLRYPIAQDHRIKTSPHNIKEDEFNIEVGTWSDSKVRDCNVSWIAFTNGTTKYSNASSSSSSTATTSTTTTTTTTTTADSDEEKKPPLEEEPEDAKKTKGKGKGKKKAKDDDKEEEEDKNKLSGTKRKDTDDGMFSSHVVYPFGTKTYKSTRRQRQYMQSVHGRKSERMYSPLWPSMLMHGLR